MCAEFSAKFTFLFPLFQIGRRIEGDAVFRGECHDPFFSSFVPANLWIPKIGNAGVWHNRVAGVFGPGFSIIKTIGQTLILKRIGGLFIFSLVVRKNSYERNLSIFSKARSIVDVRYCTAGKDRAEAVR